jgi:hypothetical protein
MVEVMKQSLLAGRKQARGVDHDANGDRRLPGHPRSEHGCRAIFRSTLKPLQHSSFPGLTIEAIAADVGKATVYRWWPNKGALVVDAFASSAESELHFPNTGSVYRDMSLQMTRAPFATARDLDEPRGGSRFLRSNNRAFGSLPYRTAPLPVLAGSWLSLPEHRCERDIGLA